ncbi:MAG: histidinol phosphatase, partial [Chloroflexi bacterium]|nr:histidinol phosphatase [Chloroflexota bacterium]
KNSLPGEEVFVTLAKGIREWVAYAELSDFPADLFEEQDDATQEMKTIHEESASRLGQLTLELQTLANKVDALKNEREQKIASSLWFKSVHVSLTAYQELVKEYQGKENTLADYGKWVQQRGMLQLDLRKMDSLRSDLGAVQQEVDTVWQQFIALREELVNKRRIFIDSVIGTNSFVRMELVPFGDVTTLEEDYRSLLELRGDVFADSVCEKFESDINKSRGILCKFDQWEPSKTHEADLPKLIADIKTKTINIAEGKELGNHGAFNKRLKELHKNKPATFDSLDCWWPEDQLRVKYAKDPSSGKFDDLEKGSAGQKAAAILAFLLSHGQEPLIIDQPEDDLDNALIYDLIVKQIHENKNRRQMIIVTHNPNIVVNGDAELVHVMEFKSGQVVLGQQGGLEEVPIREAICTIMEGGREAFDKRYRRLEV